MNINCRKADNERVRYMYVALMIISYLFNYHFDIINQTQRVTVPMNGSKLICYDSVRNNGYLADTVDTT